MHHRRRHAASHGSPGSAALFRMGTAHALAHVPENGVMCLDPMGCG
jgi:hypothetical protein